MADEVLENLKMWTVDPLCVAAVKRIEGAAADIEQLRTALSALLGRHCDLVNSGDCGFWNPEEEGEVILARSALTATE